MALERQAHLHHAQAEQDEADGAKQTENEIGQVADHRKRIAGGKAGVVKQVRHSTTAA